VTFPAPSQGKASGATWGYNLAPNTLQNRERSPGDVQPPPSPGCACDRPFTDLRGPIHATHSAHGSHGTSHEMHPTKSLSRESGE
jgi:hypothetical protein